MDQHLAGAADELQPLDWELLDRATLLRLLAEAERGRVQEREARLEAQAEVSRVEARWRSMMEHGSDFSAVLDLEGTIRDVGSAAKTLLPASPARLNLAGLHWLELVHPDDAGLARAVLAEVAGARDEAPRTVEVRAAAPSEAPFQCDWRWFEASLRNLSGDPAVGGLVLNLRDVTERRRLIDELRWQAFHDSLTGLPTRDLLVDRLQQALARRQRHGDELAVVYVDVDDFRSINDTWGHDAGDELLRDVADVLTACIRASDTAARVGPDVFVLLLDRLSDSGETSVVERILSELARPRMIAGRRLPVSACVGVALASSSGTDDAESLLRSGDIALWEAKRGGKGRVAHFDPETGQSYADRLQLVADLVRALEDGELEGGNQLHLHYQPIVQLGSAEVVGVEALARWEHPTRGLVPPMEFIPLAEENGLILPLGTWVLREACRQVRQWDERVVAAGGSPALSVSVNLSVRQLEETGLIDEVRAVLADTGLPANRLVLEVTESVLVRETDIVIANLRQLRELGVRIALDDFGTGYSALNYLQRFPIDVLKIDRSFVNGLTDPDSRLAVVQAIISIAQGLQLRTVAEGIESSTVDSQLQELGCHFGQGYLYSRPLPPKAIEDWLLQTSALALPHDELRDTAA